MYQLKDKGGLRVVHQASGLDDGMLLAYLNGARRAATIYSATHRADLAESQRTYENRKSFDFDVYRQPRAHELLHKLIELTKRNAPDLWANDFAGSSWNAHMAQGLKYVVGGKFAAHADDRVTAVVKGPSGQTDRRIVRLHPDRQIVALLYLNDNYQGGELYFPNIQGANGQPLQIKPKAGDFVLFGGDDRYLHGVKEVTQGERYVVTLWFAPLPIEPAQTLADAQRAYEAELKTT